MKETAYSYSKKERHEIYKLALAYYKKGHIPHIGMCEAICKVMYMMFMKDNLPCFPSSGIAHKYFPELDKLNTGKIHDDHYWWPLKNQEIRIKMFNKIIKETEPQNGKEKNKNNSF